MSDKPLATWGPALTQLKNAQREGENRAVARAEPLPGIHGGAVTGFWVDNTIFTGCSFQILGKDPFFL